MRLRERERRRPRRCPSLWVVLLVGLLVFGGLRAIAGCGSDDLVFPGEFEASATPAPEATPTPTA